MVRGCDGEFYPAEYTGMGYYCDEGGNCWLASVAAAAMAWDNMTELINNADPNEQSAPCD